MKNFIVALVSFLIVVGIVVGIVSLAKQEDYEPAVINRNSLLSDVTFDEKKINVYLFWGDGCPHCEELLAFFDTIKDDYGKYFNFYGFEVWENEENGKIMDKFAKELKGKVGSRGVPYLIIGDEAFSGYAESMNQKIKKTIVDKYKNKKNVRDFREIIENKE